MGAASESVSVEKDADSRAHATLAASPSAVHDSTPLVASRVLTAADESPHAAAQLISQTGPNPSVLQRAQRSYGNRASQQIVLRARAIQRKCDCGGTCTKCQEEEEQRTVQRSSIGHSSPAFDGIPFSQGEPLASDTLHPLEAHFQADLSDVRVHANTEAADSSNSLDAHAYTSGRDIYFASGMYSPSTTHGQRLLAHEVAHVVQQSSGKEPALATKSAHGVRIGAPEDSLETEADQAAHAFLHGDTLQAQDEKRSLSHPSPGSIPAVLRQPAATSAAPAAPAPPDIAPTLADAVMKNDISAAVTLMRGRSIGELANLRTAVHSRTHVYLERWFIGKLNTLDQQKKSKELTQLTAVANPTVLVVDLAVSYFAGDTEKAKVNEGPLAEEGLRWLWYALPLINRLEIYDEGYREIEQAQLDTIKHASDQEKADARKETQRLEAIYDSMDAKEEYQARTMIDPSPDGLLDAATKLLNQAKTPFWKNKDLLYTAVLALAPAVRSQFFDQHESKLSDVLWHNGLRDEFTLLKSMAHADEAAALIARLRLATEKRSDDMEGVQAVVDRAVALLGEKRGLVASKADPRLSVTDREVIEKRLREIGEVERLLQMPRDEKGKLDPGSFMGMISAARDDPDAFGADALRLGAFAPETTRVPEPQSFAFQAAKQRLLLAGDDYEALTRTFLSIHAPHVQAAPGATRGSTDLAQWSADVDFRKALLSDPAVHDVFTSMVGSHQMHVLSAIQGDDFSEALNQLNQFRNGAQWGAFFDLVLKIAEKDEWRGRYNATSSDPFGVFAGTFGGEREIMLTILRTRHMPLVALLDYTGNVATLQTAFEHISNDDRARLREGWAISRNLVMGPLTVDQDKARGLFLEFEAKVRDKLGKGSDFEDVLSAGLGSIPTIKEVSTPESRYLAAALMHERIEARLALDRGLAAEFTETDETMVAAGRQFVALWLRVRELHALTFVDFSTLAELNDTFLSRSKEFSEASRAITDLAATIAATVAGLVVVAATGGAATPAVVALAAAAGAGTGIVTREMFGGDYYRMGSDEAAKAALMDSINGALAVVSGGLAAKGTELIGLGGKALAAGAARAAGTVAEEATVSFSQKLAASAVESAIDGFFSGAVSEGFDTLLDDRTWRKGIWSGLLQAGRAAIAAGLTGMATGGVLGSATHAAGAGLSKLSRAAFHQGVDKTLARAGASELLAMARNAAQHGEGLEVTRLMDQMEAHLSSEEANILRRDLNAQLRENLGHPPGTAKPANPGQQELLRQSGLKDSGSVLSNEELEAEHFIVENSQPQISTEPGYADEVDLGNGHTWRRAEDGTWCRFTMKSLCKTTLNAAPMSPKAKARARRFEWERRQVQSAETELGDIRSKAAAEKQDLAEFDKIFDQAVQDARNGKKFDFKSLTPDQQSVVEQMFPHADIQQLEVLNLSKMERRRLESLGTKERPGIIKRLEERATVLEAALTSAKQPLSERLRGVPAEIERNMTRRAGGLDEFAKGKPVSGKLSIEHVYPLSKIMAMEGFFALDEAEMKILANWERNLKMTDLDANVLRKERSYRELSSLEFGKYYTPQNLEAAAKLEREMEMELRKELDRMLAAKPSRATIQRSPAGRNRSAALRAIPPADDGQTLSVAMRIPLESYFRVDLSDVRIHADSAAAESAQHIDAHAYASGRDIYFAPGMYAPTTDAGKRLLVHELAHVFQQGAGLAPTKVAAKSGSGTRISAPDDPLESMADREAEGFIAGAYPATQTTEARRKRPNSSDPTLLQMQPATRSFIQRDTDTTPKPGLGVTEYLDKYASVIAASLNTSMAIVDLPTGSPYASWSGGTARAFMDMMWNLSPQNLLATLRSLLEPIPPERAIDRGRDMQTGFTPEGDQFQMGTSKDAYFPDVSTELHNALTAQLNKSLQRIMPRYVARRFQLKMAQPKKASTIVPEPATSDILPAHPMDRLVINAVCSGGKVDVDFDRFGREKPPIDMPAKPGEPRPVMFEFQGGSGAWFWLRVQSPLNATIEEVASSLYGDPAQAFRMIDAAPLFGFTGVRFLQQGQKDKLKDWSTDPSLPQSALYPDAKEGAGQNFEPGELDPLAELSKSRLADDAALNQATKLRAPKNISRDAVIENMRLSFEILDAMIPNAKRFHDDGRITEARDQVDSKRNALLKADDLEVHHWAAQSIEQKRILGGASAGLAQAVAQLDLALKQANLSNPHALPAYLQPPLLELGSAYITAGVQSFFVGSGASALAAADERSRVFAVELMEGILRSVLHNIEQAEQDKTGQKEGGNEAEFGISKLRERELELRKRLSAAREQILRDPEAIDDILKQIYADVSDLQVETGIVANLDALDSAQKALWDSQSFWSDLWFQEYELRDNYTTAVQWWREQWESVYSTWKKGDHARAKEAFQYFVSRPEFRQLFEQTARYVKDAATWAIVARLLTMVAIAALSMGIGAYVEGLAATAWGGAAAASGELTGTAATAAFVGGTVAEATTFTILNTLLLDPDPTLKGFFGDLAWNLALFGLLRKMSMMYRGLSMVKAAAAAGKTTLVAAGEMGMAWATLNITAIARAEIEKQLKEKKHLTKEDIAKILLQSTAMFVGMAVASRVAEPLMKELAASGSTMGVRLRLINAQRVRLNALAEATAAGGDLAQARQIITLDRAELQSEVDFYRNLLLDPEPLADAGYTPEQIKSLREMGKQQVAELNVAEAMLEAEQIGGNEYQLDEEKIPGVLAAHKEAGATVSLIRSDPVAKSETWLVQPVTGSAIRITTKAPDPPHVQLAKMRAGLSADGKEAFDRVAAHALTPESAVEQFQKMAKSKDGLEKSAISAAKKLPVTDIVPGLYPGVKLDTSQGPWTFTTNRLETPYSDGSRKIMLATEVKLKAPDGKEYTGRAKRTITLRPNSTGSYDVDLSMDAAFLDKIPAEYRWVNEGSVPLVEGRGTPLQTYVTLMQMRSENIGLGQVTSGHLSTVINARTCCELASLGRRYAPGTPLGKLPSRLIERTQSGTYGMTNITQAGGKVRGMRIEGGYEDTVGEVVKGSDMDDDAKLKELGLSRTDKTLYGFDIVVDIEPPSSPTSGVGTKKP